MCVWKAQRANGHDRGLGLSTVTAYHSQSVWDKCRFWGRFLRVNVFGDLDIVKRDQRRGHVKLVTCEIEGGLHMRTMCKLFGWPSQLLPWLTVLDNAASLACFACVRRYYLPYREIINNAAAAIATEAGAGASRTTGSTGQLQPQTS